MMSKAKLRANLHWIVAVVAMTRSLGDVAVTTQSNPEQPTFRSGVELLRLPVAVVDRNGQPVRDLMPTEFSVRIDGHDRTTLFAHFFGGPENREAAPANGSVASGWAAVPGAATNTHARAGRVVVFVVDLISIKQGHERAMLDSAAALSASLGPNDAVGLLPITGRGVDISRDQARVSQALRGLQGTTIVPFITHSFSLSEAIAFEQSNRRLIAQTIERECCISCSTCPMELRDETREFLRYARYHVQTVLTSMTGLATALQSIRAPKSIILISAGLPFEQESLSRFTDLQKSLMRAGTMVYAIQVSQPDNDATNMRRPGVGVYQAADITTGLGNIASMAGGAMFMGVGTASRIFERVRTEIASSYELGIESTPADYDQKEHEVKIVVKRPGVTVRSPAKLSLTAAPLDADRTLGDLLAQPVDVDQLPITIDAYSVRGDDSATLKVIIVADLSTDTMLAPPLRYALTALRDGKVAFATNASVTSGRRLLTAAQLEPGVYRLRLAALDGTGRAGTVEIPLTVGLRDAAPLQLSDLMIGAMTPSFTPALRATASKPLATLLELYSSEPRVFENVKVTFELRRSPDGGLLTSTEGTLRRTDFERRELADGSLLTESLKEGDYFVSAVAFVGDKAVGRVSRAVSIGR